MEKQKIKQREIKKKKVIIQYYIYCPICNKEIKGTKPTQVDYNLKLHLDKHKKQKNELQKNA